MRKYIDAANDLFKPGQPDRKAAPPTLPAGNLLVALEAARPLTPAIPARRKPVAESIEDRLDRKAAQVDPTASLGSMTRAARHRVLYKNR